MDTSNPNQRLADAVREHRLNQSRIESPVAKARAATHPEESEWHKDSLDRSEKHVHDIQRENSILVKGNQIKGSGKSPLSTPMSPTKGKK